MAKATKGENGREDPDAELKRSVSKLCTSLQPPASKVVDPGEAIKLEIASKQRIAEQEMFTKILTSDAAPQGLKDDIAELVRLKIEKEKNRIERDRDDEL